jgi:hypothetical protein
MAIKVKRIILDREDMYDDGFEDILADLINEESENTLTSDNVLSITQNQNEFTIFYEDDDDDDDDDTVTPSSNK